jgi:hypothetical protein
MDPPFDEKDLRSILIVSRSSAFVNEIIDAIVSVVNDKHLSL